MFVGSFKIWRMLCKREVVPRDSLKAALSGQATPCRGKSAYGFFQGLLKYCAAWALHEPSFLFIHCRPVPKTPVLRGHMMCVIREVPKAMVTVETEATCEMTLCQSCPWRHFKSPDDPQPELIPHASEWNTTRLSSLALCPPGWVESPEWRGMPVLTVTYVCCSCLLLSVGWRFGETASAHLSSGEEISPYQVSITIIPLVSQ